MEQLGRGMDEVLYGGESAREALAKVRVDVSKRLQSVADILPRFGGGKMKRKTFTGLAFCSPLIFG